MAISIKEAFDRGMSSHFRVLIIDGGKAPEFKRPMPEGPPQEISYAEQMVAYEDVYQRRAA